MATTILKVKHSSVKAFCICIGVWAMLLSGAQDVFAAGDGGYAAPYFQADFIQTLSEWHSPLVNPALLYRVNQKHWDFGWYQYAIAEEGLGYQQMSLLWPYYRNHTFGGTLLWNSSGIDGVRIDGTPTGLRYYFMDFWFIFHYSWRIIPAVSIGANLKLRYEDQFNIKEGFSTVPGIDIGVYWNPIDHYRYGDLGVSVNVQDIVPTQINWGDEAATPDFENEMVVNRARVGVRYAALNDNLVWDGELVLDNALRDLIGAISDSYMNMAKALDSLGNLDGVFPITPRFGSHFKIMFIYQVWLKCGLANTYTPYLGFNYNLIYLLPEMINYVNLDFHMGYNFLDRAGTVRDDRGFTLMTKIGTDFGQTREQFLSKKLYDKLILAPMDAYNEAMRLYLAGKYWEAGFAFGKVLSLFPNFHLNDKATWYLGDSYTKLYMNDIAREVFKEALEEYTTSEMRSKYIYGLERLDYREGNYDDALKNHAFIINLYPESEIRADADYLAGEIQFLRKNYNVAEQLFTGIKPGDPSYLYAQYTLAIINVENNKEQTAIQCLTSIIKDSTQESSDQLLQDAANLKLGHVYYESGDKLRQAVEAYQRVPDGSPFQDEALLATAWSWMKVNRPAEAVQAVEHLIFNHPESPLVPEAYLVKGYALMLLKRNAEAVNTLEQCLNACKQDFVTAEALEKRKAKFEEYVTKFSPTSGKIKKNALRKPTNKTLEERPELEKEFQKYAKESKAFFVYTLLAKSHSRFFMRKDEVVTDAEYALAKATAMMKAKDVISGQKKADEQEQKIKDEEEKLKRELEELEKQEQE
ncbi:MAG: tetratricopeptide repeat protein [Chitinispirillaceae bacterium]|nr:tetratricopeptide repeat protein [Chitinispirillaceae bacterium]